jgi:serine/threonine protein kinase/tetratricopeptide (TPR) repeat protein
MIGQVVSHYRIIEKLGGGGMGVVYKAEDVKLKRFVALKFLPPEIANDPAAVARFQREAQSASALNHPNICTIYDIDEADGQHFIAMELLTGHTLKHRIDGRPLSPGRVLEFSIHIVDALEAAHAAGIVHRDIKPANIFVTDRGQAKILDFGLAKLSSHAKATAVTDESGKETLTRETTAGTVFGTVEYMSPEQVRGEELDGRSDLFSFGLTLYEMATGHRAFEGATAAATFGDILYKRPVPPRHLNSAISADLERVILRALEKDRSMRYQSAADLLAELKRIARDSGSVHPVIADDVKPARTRLLKYGAAAVAMVLLVSSVFVWKALRPKPLTDRDVVVLADFVNTTGESVFDDALKQGLSVKLEESPFLNIMSAQQMRSALQLMGRTADERITNSIAREICQREGHKAMISGSISALGKSYVLGLEAANCSTGESLAREQAEADAKEHVLQALGQAAASLRAKLGESIASVQKLDQPLEQATTASLEALKAYSQGFAEQGTGSYIAAIELHRHAIELDPNFALAYARLSACYSTIGELQQARNNIEKAFALINRTSEHERLYITATYYFLSGNTEKEVEAYELYKHTYPRDFVPYNNLGNAYLDLGQFEKALAEYLEAIRMQPRRAPAYNNAIDTYTKLNRLDEAKAIHEKLRSLKIESAYTHPVRLRVALMEADARSVAEEMAWFGGKPEEYNAFVEMASADEYAGHWHKAVEDRSHAVELAAGHKLMGVVGAERAKEALGNAIQDRCESVRDQARRALELDRDANTVLPAGVALALCGDAVNPPQLADELHKSLPDSTFNNAIAIPSLRAAVEITKNQPANAVEILKSSTPYETANILPVYLRGIAYLRAGSAREAAGEFEKILGRKGAYWLNALIYTAAHLGLARASAQAGDRERSRKAYQDFLALWKDADPDLALLQQAKTEYAKSAAKNTR